MAGGEIDAEAATTPAGAPPQEHLRTGRPWHRRRVRRIGLAAGALLAAAPALVIAAVARAALLPPPLPATGGLAAPANLPPPPGTTTSLSTTAAGVQGNLASQSIAISGDGRWAAFSSKAANLVPNDTNGVADMFVRNLATGAIQRVPYPAGVAPGVGSQASNPSFSADGEWLAFDFLLGGEANFVYLWQRSTNVTVEPSLPKGPLIFSMMDASISPDGAFMTFSGLVNVGENLSGRQVFLWDRVNRTANLVSVNSRGSISSGQSTRSSVANGGTAVVFMSSAVALTADPDNNTLTDIYLRDLTTKQTVLLTPTTGNFLAVPGFPNRDPKISADGRFVAFTSAFPYSPLDTNTADDVYRFDRKAATLELVSTTAAGTAAAGSSEGPAISPDGRYVAFQSSATTILPDPIPGATGPNVRVPTIEVYIREMVAPETIRVSTTIDGQAAGQSVLPSIADDGGRVAFTSVATNLVANDVNGAQDVFLRDIPGVLTPSPAGVDFGTLAVGIRSAPIPVTLSNTGWADLRIKGPQLAGTNAGDFTVQADTCAGSLLVRGKNCAVTLVYGPRAGGDRNGLLNVFNSTVRSPLSIKLHGLASDAKLVLSDKLGALGRVVTATGSGFPPGAAVRLRWTVGVTPTLPLIVADAKGTFRVQVLVFHHDPTGPRKLIAEPAPNAPQFLPTEADYLVTEPPAIPPGFGVPGPLPDAIVIRR